MNSTPDNFGRFRPQGRERRHCLHQTIRLALSVVWLCGSFPGLWAQNLSPDERPYNLHGVVINSVTREPIGHALVFSSDHHFATMTDDQGHFEFALPRRREPSQIAPGSVEDFQIQEKMQAFTSPQLSARKPGYLDATPERGVTQGQREVTIPLVPEALVVGRVMLADESDRIPVELFHYEVQEGHTSWIPVGTVVARSNGEFRFAGLRAGKYKLLTHEVLDRDPLVPEPGGQLYGFAPVFFPSAPDFGSAATIDLAAGNTFQATLTPIRQPYYPVKVPIALGSSSEPIRVEVSAQGHPGPGYALGYNQQEQRMEGSLPDGNYTVEVSNAGSGPVPTYGMVNISVKGGPLLGPPIVLVPASSIAVIVKEEFGSTEYPMSFNWNINGRNVPVKGPRRYLSIRLWLVDGLGLEETVSPAPPTGSGDDALTIAAPPGRYWVQVNSTRGFPASVSSSDVDLQRHPLVVGRGGSAPPIEITMRDDWAQISGKIEYADDSPSGASPAQEGLSSASGPGPVPAVAWGCLVPLPESPEPFQQIAIPFHGETGDQQVVPGDYRVLAFDREPQDFDYRDPEVMRAYDSKGQVVHLVAGQKTHVTLSLIITGESR